MALDGLTGKELWRHYSAHELFGINCNEDLNSDGILDCTGGGRAGVCFFYFAFTSTFFYVLLKKRILM